MCMICFIISMIFLYDALAFGNMPRSDRHVVNSRPGGKTGRPRCFAGGLGHAWANAPGGKM